MSETNQGRESNDKKLKQDKCPRKKNYQNKTGGYFD